jgi:hypothetical protein
MINAQPLAKVHTAPCSIKVKNLNELYSIRLNGLNKLNTGQKPSLERQSTLYDETKSSASLAAPAASVSTAEEELEFYGGDYYGDGSDYQQYDAATGYEYNYSDYYGTSEGGGGDQQQESYPGYVLDETGTWVVDDGSLSHDYGYYDETGYYYDGQWYPATTYDESGAASWTAADGYADYTTQQQGSLIFLICFFIDEF